MAPQGPATAGIVKIPRVLVVDAVVANNGVQNPVLTIPQDADFEWWWISISRTSALMKLLLKESATSRDFIYAGSPPGAGTAFQGVFVDNLAGLVASNGAFPIAVPYVMPASRAYSHTLQDQGSGGNNTVEIAYHGFALLQVAG